MSRTALARHAITTATSHTRRGSQWTTFGPITYLGDPAGARLELRGDPGQWNLTEYDRHGHKLWDLTSSEPDAAQLGGLVAELMAAIPA